MFIGEGSAYGDIGRVADWPAYPNWRFRMYGKYIVAHIQDNSWVYWGLISKDYLIVSDSW